MTYALYDRCHTRHDNDNCPAVRVLYCYRKTCSKETSCQLFIANCAAAQPNMHRGRAVAEVAEQGPALAITCWSLFFKSAEKPLLKSRETNKDPGNGLVPATSHRSEDTTQTLTTTLRLGESLDRVYHGPQREDNMILVNSRTQGRIPQQ